MESSKQMQSWQTPHSSSQQDLGVGADSRTLRNAPTLFLWINLIPSVLLFLEQNTTLTATGVVCLLRVSLVGWEEGRNGEQKLTGKQNTK